MSLTIESRFDTGAEQRFAALRRANEIRTGRAQLKREIKAGRVDVRSLLINPPDLIESMRIIDMLLAMPKTGRVKATKLLSRVPCTQSREIGRMTERERLKLASLIG